MAFFNDSKFNMWRGCIGVIWIDGKVDEKEQEWMKEKLNSLPFTPEQKVVLEQDLANGVRLESVLPQITDRKDRAFLAHQVRVIGHLDGEYSSDEKEFYEKWNKIILDGVDLDFFNALIEADEKASYHEDEVYKVANKTSIFENVHRSAQKIMNPGDYKYPQNDEDE